MVNLKKTVVRYWTKTTWSGTDGNASRS